MSLRSILHNFIFGQSILSRFLVKKGLNFDGGNKTSGNFSVIYQAEDSSLSKEVVLKFYDPDVAASAAESYRYDSFKREVEVLNQLKGKYRCPQIITDIEQLEYAVPLKDQVLKLPASFFAMDFYPRSYEMFTFGKGITAEKKLNVFRKMVLATFAIHREEVFHRDIKIEHFRGNEDDEEIYLVDFGTSIGLRDERIRDKYFSPPGTFEYAAPEAKVGLSCIRDIQKQGDLFALGAILFEMFNPNLFHEVYYEGEAEKFLKASINALLPLATYEEKFKKYVFLLDLIKADFKVPKIDLENGTVPLSIKIELQRLFELLVNFDFRLRADYPQILRRIDICLNVLRSSAAQRTRSEALERKRERRVKKLFPSGVISNV